MKNLILVVGVLGLVSTPAVAGRSKMNKSSSLVVKAKKGLGDSFDLGPRRSVQPKEEMSIVESTAKLRTLSELQISTVVSKRSGDIRHCWNKLPQAQRVDACSVMLKLTVEPAGNVSGIELAGDVPAGAHKCITSAVMRWQFPAAPEQSEIETGISLRSL